MLATGGKPAASGRSPVAIPTGFPPPLRPSGRAGSTPQAAPLKLGDRPEQRVPMSRLRARVAERLLQSQSTNAILTTFNEVNMAPVMEMRKKFQEKFEKEHGVKLGFMSFFVKAAVACAEEVSRCSTPRSTATTSSTTATSTSASPSARPRGLVVPILRNADQMSFADIEKKIAEFGKKAQRTASSASKS